MAFSGGADSAFLARVATDTLGPDRVLCVTAVSPSLAPEELADCRALAAEWGLRYLEVATDELADPAYAANDGSRCYHCKASLMDALGPGHRRRPARGATVVLGVNLDDLSDHRPGQAAAAERGAVFPLVDRRVHQGRRPGVVAPLGLRTWDKPAAACLASRVPYGTPVTFTTLDSVARAESGLRALGFRQLRVRHYGDTARIEVPDDDLAEVVARRDEVARRGARRRLPLRDPRPRRVPVGQPEPGALDRRRHRHDRRRRHDRSPRQADVPRGAGPRAGHRPDGRGASPWCPTSAGPTSASRAAGSSASWTATPAWSTRPLAWLRTEGVQVDLLGDIVES